MTLPTASFTTLVQRLSAASVRHRSEAYRDIAWDDPALAVDGEDPRWELPAWDPIGASIWYRERPAHERARIGLLRVVALVKVGVEFEAVLQQGLLDYAATLPDRHPSFRYVYHEITEEAQHSMMFQELIDRSGVDLTGPSGDLRRLYGTIVNGTGTGWILMFLVALTAEDVFDRFQRQLLDGGGGHPLFRRISEIHVAEEARHLAFARAFLRESVPTLTAQEHRSVRARVPLVVEWMTRHILEPAILVHALATDWGAPPDVVREITGGPVAGTLRSTCTAGVVDTCAALGLVDARGAWPAAALRWMAPRGPEEGR